MKSCSRLTLLTISLATAGFLTSCGIDLLSTSQKVGYRTGPELREVPPEARTETRSGTRYFTHEGTYYRPRNGRYVPVEPGR